MVSAVAAMFSITVRWPPWAKMAYSVSKKTRNRAIPSRSAPTHRHLDANSCGPVLHDAPSYASVSWRLRKQAFAR